MKPTKIRAKFFPPRKIFKKKFFQIPNVYNAVMSYMYELENEKRVISNFVQGQLWQSKKKNNEGKMFYHFLFRLMITKLVMLSVVMLKYIK